MENYSLADIGALMGSRDGGFGGMDAWGLIILVVLILFGGGGLFGRSGERNATVADIQRSQDFSALERQNNETVAAVPETEYYEQITDIARFLLHLLDEKETLSAAIRTAKDALDIDMDSEVSLNAARQSVARTFRHMNDLRCSEQTIPNGGSGYRFNADGNQITYRCDVRRVTTINYDRKVIRAALTKLDRRADETSARIDLCLVTSDVAYTPPFDVNASFAEAFAVYTGKDEA